MRTNRDTVRYLCRRIISRLENNGVIQLAVNDPKEVEQELWELVSPNILTEQHVHEWTLEKIGASEESLEGNEISSSVQYQTARRMIRADLGEDRLHGFYFQKSLKGIADDIIGYLMESDKIEDVFDTDENIEQSIVDTIKNFNPKNLH